MKTKKLVTTSMLIAIATLLSFVRIFSLPFGGSVTLVSMLPIVIISYIYGVRWGLFSALVFSLLQMATGVDTISAFFLPGDSHMALGSAIAVCIIEYIFAFTAIGLGGIFRGKLKNGKTELCLGVIFSLSVRYILHIISGAIFFGVWANWFFSESTGLSQIGFLKGFCDWVMSSFDGFGLALFYSIIYNGAYMIPEIIITSVCASIIYNLLKSSDIMGNFNLKD